MRGGKQIAMGGGQPDSEEHGELLAGLRSHSDNSVSVRALAALVRGAKKRAEVLVRLGSVS